MAHFQDVKIFAWNILHSHLVLNEHQLPCSLQGRAKSSQKIQREAAASNARPLTTPKWNYWSISFCSARHQGQTSLLSQQKLPRVPTPNLGTTGKTPSMLKSNWKEQMLISHNQGCKKYSLIFEIEWGNIYSAFCFSFPLAPGLGAPGLWHGRLWSF